MNKRNINALTPETKSAIISTASANNGKIPKDYLKFLQINTKSQDFIVFMKENSYSITDYKISLEEEYELIREAQAGNREAADKICKAHLGMAYSLADKYSTPSTRDDRRGIACLTLCEALYKFNLNYGAVRFGAFAKTAIKRELADANGKDSLIVVKEKVSSASYKVKCFADSENITNWSDADFSNCAERLNMSDRRVKNYVYVLATRNVDSTSVGIIDDDMYGTDVDITEISDTATSVSGDNVINLPAEELAINELQMSKLYEFVDSLPDDYKYIIVNLFGLKDGKEKMVKDIAEDLGVSEFTIRKMRKDAFNYLRTEVNSCVGF